MIRSNDIYSHQTFSGLLDDEAPVDGAGATSDPTSAIVAKQTSSRRAGDNDDGAGNGGGKSKRMTRSGCYSFG